METLPLEILLHIASFDLESWRGLLQIRKFAEYTLLPQCRNFVISNISAADYSPDEDYSSVLGCTLLRGVRHSFFDRPIIDFNENAKYHLPPEYKHTAHFIDFIHFMLSAWTKKDGDLLPRKYDAFAVWGFKIRWYHRGKIDRRSRTVVVRWDPEWCVISFNENCGAGRPKCTERYYFCCDITPTRENLFWKHSKAEYSYDKKTAKNDTVLTY